MNDIFVTQPSLPVLSDFIPYLEKIWKSKNLTNNGIFHTQFEEALAEYLGVKYVSLFCNGTIALLVGLRALEIEGEVITTPFTFVATAHAIKWAKLTPVFCDIENETYNINSDKIEPLITEKTKAIMPVHVYGNPCNIEKFDNIARKNKLKVFYDAAHAFGVKKDNYSILNCGDLSMLSFHATKIFNTFEGGALITNNFKLKQKIDKLKNFAFENEATISGLGINGKMNEFQAALGCLQLKYIAGNIEKCKIITEFYRKQLNYVSGISFLSDMQNINHNYSYFPILVDEKKYGISRDILYKRLKEYKIMSRKYFYPLVSNLEIYKELPSASIENLPVANKKAEQVLCLPIYPDLDIKEIERIVSIITKI